MGLPILSFFETPKVKRYTKERDEFLTKYMVMVRQQEALSEFLLDIENRDNNKYRSVFEMDVISKDVRTAGVGGSIKPLPYEYLEFFDVVRKATDNLENLRRRLYIQSISFDDVEVMALQKDKNECNCDSASQFAIMTSKEMIPDETKKRLELFFGKYWS